MRRWLIAAAVCLSAEPARAQQDADGAQDHPRRGSVALFGDTKPVTPNTAEAGRAQNRRVELVKK